MWPSLYDWHTETSQKMITLKKNQKCVIIDTQNINGEKLFKMMVEDSGLTGWIVAGKYPSFEIIS